MNDFVKKWVKELRSGKYEQSKGHLNKDGKFCCLGIACDIMHKEKRLAIQKQGGITYYYGDNQSKRHMYGDTFPPSVALEVGASIERPDLYPCTPNNPCYSSNPSVTYKGERVMLSKLNDEYNLTFLEIADLIEGQL